MTNQLEFHIAVHSVRQRDTRYAPQAYAFLCEALEHTVRAHHKEGDEDRHVRGQELLAGFRELALQEFGPLALLVMRDWGIQCSEDVGNMVYNFITVKFFGRNETDSIEDFSDGISMEEELTKPFRSKRRAA